MHGTPTPPRSRGRASFHEELRREDELPVASNRLFGIAFTVVFTVIALWPVVFHGGPPRWWAFGMALLFAFVTLVRADLLRHLNRRWARVALFLHGVISFVAMAVIFYLVFTPVALVLKLLRKDLLRRRLDLAAATYWIARETPREPADMRRQF